MHSSKGDKTSWAPSHGGEEETYPSKNPWGAKSSVRNRQLHKWLGSNPISQEQSQVYLGVKERRQTEPKDRAADPSGIQSTLPSQGPSHTLWQDVEGSSYTTKQGVMEIWNDRLEAYNTSKVCDLNFLQWKSSVLKSPRG